MAFERVLRAGGPVVVVLLVLLDPRVSMSQACAGDCNRDGVVTISELTVAVGIALGGSIAGCRAVDVDRSLAVDIWELVAAVGFAMEGCDAASASGSPTPTQTGVPSSAGTPTSSPRATVSRDSEMGASFVAAARRVCGGGTSLRQGSYGIECVPGRGHYLQFVVGVETDAAQANARFDALVPADVGEEEFAGYRAAYWQVDGIALRFWPQYFLWVADCVFVYSTKLDDTPLGSNPSLAEASNEMLDWIVEYAVPQCPG